ncbi:MAG: 3-hydroxyacyl-CoA dehydrogenase [Pseudomonadota bacterium]
MKPVSASDYTVAVIGAGAMGQGIAQVSAQGGMKTLLVDANAAVVDKARQSILGRINRLVEKGRVEPGAAAAAESNLHAVGNLADIAEADCVVEAVFEDLDVKRTLFREIEAVVRPDCIIASNTSSIPISSVAQACEHKGRVGGLHFFNPVPLMKLVEVIEAAETTPEVIAALTEIGKRMTRVPVTVKDMPGFLVNMGGRAFTSESLRIAHEGVATPTQVDAIMRDCCHFRMGPFELMDLTGIDVNYPVSGIIYRGYMDDPRIKTSPNHTAKFDAGQFGRKTGQGWYRYEDGKAVDVPSPDLVPDAAPATRVALMDEGDRLEAFVKELGLEVIEDDGTVPLIAAPIGTDATHLSVDAAVDPKRFVALDLMFDTSKRVTLMTAPGADFKYRDAVAAAVIASGRKVTAIKDSPGFVAQRMCAMIGNLGCYMAEVGLAAPDDIDLALELGLNYPHGPLKLINLMGVEEALEVLEELHEITAEDRYRPTMWLKRRALLELPIHTPS